MYITAVALLALGCSDEGPKGETIEPREEMTPTIPEVTPSEAGPELTEELDCAFDAGEVSVVAEHMMLVFEDIDLLSDQRVVTGANNHILAYTDWGSEMEMFGYGLGINPTGIRSLASGSIAVADVSEGTVSLVDPASGGITILASALSNPNGLTAARSGSLYVSEHINGGRILHVDPETSDIEALVTFGESESPNGLAIEPGEESLVVALGVDGGARIERIDLETGDRTEVASFSGVEIDTVGVDSCGGVYAVPYSGGSLYRITSGGGAEEIFSLPGELAFISGMRWGIGADDLPRDHMYLSSQHHGVTEIAIGVTGAPTAF